MSAKIRNLIIGVFFLLFGAFIYYKSLSIKAMMQNDVGSAFFPKVVAVLMMALAVVRIILALRQKDDKADAKKDSDLPGGWITIVLICVYCAVFKRVGFIVSTIVYLLAQIFVLTPKEKRSIPILVAVSVIAPIVIYVLFTYVINTPLPKGIFGF